MLAFSCKTPLVQEAPANRMRSEQHKWMMLKSWMLLSWCNTFNGSAA